MGRCGGIYIVGIGWEVGSGGGVGAGGTGSMDNYYTAGWAGRLRPSYIFQNIY